MTKTISIGYGILCDPISKQIDDMGLTYNEKEIKGFEIELDAIQTLRFGSGLLTDSMYDKMLPKLHKKIVSHIAKQNKMSINK
jgi:hypothetical protein